jgi:hypothetical protein
MLHIAIYNTVSVRYHLSSKNPVSVFSSRGRQANGTRLLNKMVENPDDASNSIERVASSYPLGHNMSQQDGLGTILCEFLPSTDHRFLLKNDVFWDVRLLAFVRTDVSEELSASFIRVTRIGELETTIAVTSNRRTLRRN